MTARAIQSWRLGVDIGGTFTDLVLASDTEVLTHKVLTTHDDPARGVVEAIGWLIERSPATPDGIRLLLHGTTLATNALIERRGARTALLCTAGHRDALQMAFENRFEQYDLQMDRPTPLVPRRWRVPVMERLAADGTVLVPLDLDDLQQRIDRLAADGIESVAVGLLHAYQDPAHEQQVAAQLARRLPDVSVSLSSEVCPEIREFERLSTTCANAYVRPLMDRYLGSLERQLHALGIRAPLLLMTSGGGLTTLEAARRFPIRLVESGPAGGALLAARLAGELGEASVLSFDMGGTTAKICLIDQGQPLLSRAFEVDRVYRFKKGSGLPVRIPVIEMVEIGAGGGSLAVVDQLGRLRVGPESAGSEPGPVAYARGGQTPTVTDADLVLGRLDPAAFAGGRMTLDAASARAALAEQIGLLLEVPAEDAAAAVAEIVDENMAAAARAHGAEWGRDLGQRTLIAFGGAAPLHAAALARKLKLGRVLIPAGAGVGSALGFLLAPVSYEVVRSRYQRLSRFEPGVVNEAFTDMRAEAAAVVAAALPAAQQTSLREVRRAYMRYLGQGYEVAVPVPDRILEAGDAPALISAFEAEYQQVYGRSLPGQDVEVLSWTLTLAGPEPDDLPAESPESGAARGLDDHWQVYGSGPQIMMNARRIRRNDLAPQQPLSGPVIVVEQHTTTYVPEDFRAVKLPGGHLLLERLEEAT